MAKPPDILVWTCSSGFSSSFYLRYCYNSQNLPTFQSGQAILGSFLHFIKVIATIARTHSGFNLLIESHAVWIISVIIPPTRNGLRYCSKNNSAKADQPRRGCAIKQIDQPLIRAPATLVNSFVDGCFCCCFE
jgi:hypothetical protein